MPTKAQVNEAAWFSAFGETTRLAIIRALSTGEKTVTELAKASEVELVNVSHHLSILKELGLIAAEKDGRFRVYSLVGATMTETSLSLSDGSGATVVIPLS